MSRIIRTRPSDDEYVLPETGGFTEDYVSTAWHVSPGKERHTVRIMLCGRMSEIMREVQLNPTQKVEGDVLTAEVPHLDEVARWVVSCCGDAVVLEPEELRVMVRNYAERILEPIHKKAPPL